MEGTLKNRVNRKVVQTIEEDTTRECPCGVASERDDSMVQCAHCRRWFHMSCARIRVHLTGTAWWCPPCRTTTELQLPSYRNLQGAEVAYAVLQHSRGPLTYKQIVQIAFGQRWITADSQQQLTQIQTEVEKLSTGYHTSSATSSNTNNRTPPPSTNTTSTSPTPTPPNAGPSTSDGVGTSKGTLVASGDNETSNPERSDTGKSTINLQEESSTSDSPVFCVLDGEHCAYVTLAQKNEEQLGTILLSFREKRMGMTIFPMSSWKYIPANKEHIWFQPKQSQIPTSGLGLYLRKHAPTIQSGTIIAEFRGNNIIQDPSQVSTLFVDTYPYGVELECTGLKPQKKAVIINGVDTDGNLLSYAALANDAGPQCTNCELSEFEQAPGRVFMQATQTIRGGDEIFLSYGSSYWGLSEYPEMDSGSFEQALQDASKLPYARKRADHGHDDESQQPKVETRPCPKCGKSVHPKCLKLHAQSCKGDDDDTVHVDTLTPLLTAHSGYGEPILDSIITTGQRLSVCKVCHGMVETHKYEDHLEECTETALCHKCGENVPRSIWGEHCEFCGPLEGTTPQPATPHTPSSWLQQLYKQQAGEAQNTEIECRKCLAIFPPTCLEEYKAHTKSCEGCLCIPLKAVPLIFSEIQGKQLQYLGYNMADTMKNTISLYNTPLSTNNQPTPPSASIYNNTSTMTQQEHPHPRSPSASPPHTNNADGHPREPSPPLTPPDLEPPPAPSEPRPTASFQWLCPTGSGSRKRERSGDQKGLSITNQLNALEKLMQEQRLSTKSQQREGSKRVVLEEEALVDQREYWPLMWTPEMTAKKKRQKTTSSTCTTTTTTFDKREKERDTKQLHTGQQQQLDNNRVHPVVQQGDQTIHDKDKLQNTPTSTNTSTPSKGMDTVDPIAILQDALVPAGGKPNLALLDREPGAQPGTTNYCRIVKNRLPPATTTTPIYSHANSGRMLWNVGTVDLRAAFSAATNQSKHYYYPIGFHTSMLNPSYITKQKKVRFDSWIEGNKDNTVPIFCVRAEDHDETFIGLRPTSPCDEIASRMRTLTKEAATVRHSGPKFFGLDDTEIKKLVIQQADNLYIRLREQQAALSNSRNTGTTTTQPQQHNPTPPPTNVPSNRNDELNTAVGVDFKVTRKRGGGSKSSNSSSKASSKQVRR